MFSVALVFILGISMSQSSPLASDEDRVKCFVCQWSQKTGYDSPFSQNCTIEYLRANPRKYVETCASGRGCFLRQVKEGSKVIAETRGCSNSAQNGRIVARYCRTNDCTQTDNGNGTTVTAHAIKCRTVNPVHNTTLIDKLSNGTSRVADYCSNDTTNYNYFCTRTTTWTDVVLGGPSSTYPGPTYNLACSSPIDKALWTGTDYWVTTKYCVNSFCNADVKASAAYLKVAVTTVLGLALIGLRINIY